MVSARFLPLAALATLWGLVFLGGWFAVHARVLGFPVMLSMAAFPVGYAGTWHLYHRLISRRTETKKATPFLFFLNFFVSDLLQIFNPFALVFIGSQCLAILMLKAAPPGSEPVIMRLPFRGKWLVANGGTTRRASHSWMITAQRYAYDFVVGSTGAETARRGDGHLNDYAAYGQAVFAPVSGKIVSVRRNCRDSPYPGSGWLDWWGIDPRGNHVLIECAPNTFVLLAHLRCNSVEVSQGQTVEAGSKIGECGNSGRSTEPHLHLHCQRGSGMAFAVGLPIVFLNGSTTPGAEVDQEGGLQFQREMQVESIAP